MDYSVLNKEQREAVECVEGPLLVLAGAGSGKTRVLTYRIAHMIQDCNVAPWNILALTFTNKAAGQMRERIEDLLGSASQDIWITTFHACCARILRRDIDKLGYDRSFVIYDDADQISVIGEIIKTMQLDDQTGMKRMYKSAISDAKNHSLRPQEYLAQMGGGDILEIFRAYEKQLKRNNALDFDDLLLKVLELFEKEPEILEEYRRKFRYVLVDEYQDTNMAQYQIIRLLCAKSRNICVVGDDDQSIYGWRGADIRNILEFEKDFPGAKVIRLEQNYRSTQKILDAANGVIQNNSSRKRKQLWTDKQGGETITYFTTATERQEADYVCGQILAGVRNDRRYDDFAVLYRMNAQSRMLETMLTSYGIPYRVYGGMRFYERKEIKDVMAYLRLIQNPADDVAFMRIVNVPRRGLGESAIQELQAIASAQEIPLFLAAMDTQTLSKRVQGKLAPFLVCIQQALALKDTMPLNVLAQQLLEEIEYDAYLRDDKRRIIKPEQKTWQN